MFSQEPRKKHKINQKQAEKKEQKSLKEQKFFSYRYLNAVVTCSIIKMAVCSPWNFFCIFVRSQLGIFMCVYF